MVIFSRILDDGNNDAVEQLLTGSPEDAIPILQHVLERWRLQKTQEQDTPRLDFTKRQHGQAEQDFCNSYDYFYTVDIDPGLAEPIPDPAFPFQWYGKAIAICTPDEIGEKEMEESLCQNDGLKLAVVLYNLGIACQLVSVHKNGYTCRGFDHEPMPAFRIYVSALRVLSTYQDDVTVAVTCSGLALRSQLQLGIVNNLLFLYAQEADLAGMLISLEALRNGLSGVEISSEETRAVVELFECNALLFPIGWHGLRVSPAA